jgi:glycerate dehydrogenase
MGENIVVVDGFALNPGDLRWDALERFGDVTVYERTSPAEFIERTQDATVILTNKVRIREEQFAQLPKLRYVGITATGYDIIDLEAARARQIVVTNARNYGSPTVAQHTFAMLLALTNHVAENAASVAQGDWVNSTDWCYWKQPITELDGLTLGLMGFGSIAQHVAGIAQAFGMKVCVHTRTPRANTAAISFVSRDEMFAQSDIISLHCPLNEATQALINRETLAKMRPHALLLNTARGALIDEAALAEALTAGTIAGAALDVLSQEPPSPSNPLLTAPNCLITPHCAWASRAARERLLQQVVENLQLFLQGTPRQVL